MRMTERRTDLAGAGLGTEGPTRADIERTAARLAAYVRETPVLSWDGEATGGGAVLKLELFQHGGSFKTRGALVVMLDLPPDVLRRGVTAVSAGNHAIAVAWAAGTLGTTAKVVMPRTANAFRVARCRALGAEVVLADDVHQAFALTEAIERDEGRTLVHPFEGPLTALGTASLGLELLRQVPDLDAVVVPVGGGGLAAGVSAAVKLLAPGCLVIGVEPEGNDTMKRSLASGKPERAAEGGPRTIADSLSPPYALPYSFGLCRKYLDDLVLVSDDELCRALALLFRAAKLAVEPAGAASTAALMGPLRERLGGKRVGLIVCGTNIDAASFSGHLARGDELLRQGVRPG